ncbi:MAG: trimeric autotransporter adhesin, partial [Verrucomicrobiota bacterium]
GLADSFDPNANNFIQAIAVQSDGKILASGFFTSIGGQTRNFIARLDATAGLADSFDPNANSNVTSIALKADGKVLAGGTFTSIGGQTRNFFARLSNDTAALQNLAVTQTTVTWTRGGSSPQFARVTFESSTDNVNYTLLGNGTASGSNWTLTGLNLPAGQNFYIRARGYYGSGQRDGSASITESVRNVFITLPPTPTQVVSRKLHNGAPFDIDLPLTGDAGIECRSGGATNDHQVVFTFPNAVTFTNAAVTAGTGSVSSSSGSGTTTVTVNLTGVTNAQRITVTLSGVSDSTTTGDLAVPLGVLLGDTTGNGHVNSSDISQTHAESGNPVTSSNFREDVTVNGFINSSDIALVESQSGTDLPPQPASVPAASPAPTPTSVAPSNTPSSPVKTKPRKNSPRSGQSRRIITNPNIPPQALAPR